MTRLRWQALHSTYGSQEFGSLFCYTRLCHPNSCLRVCRLCFAAVSSPRTAEPGCSVFPRATSGVGLLHPRGFWKPVNFWLQWLCVSCFREKRDTRTMRAIPTESHLLHYLPGSVCHCLYRQSKGSKNLPHKVSELRNWMLRRCFEDQRVSVLGLRVMTTTTLTLHITGWMQLDPPCPPHTTVFLKKMFTWDEPPSTSFTPVPTKPRRMPI